MNPIIRLYGPIGDPDDGVTSKMVSDQLEQFKNEPEIEVRINSVGGSVMQGLAIAGFLDQHPAKIHTVIEGGAYSIAGFIAVCGDKRSIASNAPLHIHGPRVPADVGTLEDHEDAIEELKIARKSMAARYAKVTGMPVEKILSDFSRDRFYSAEKAVELGYMTDICDGSAMAAKFMKANKSLFPSDFATALVEKDSDETDGGHEMPTKTPATPKEMRTKFKRAGAEFILGQLETEATLETATAAYVKAMEEENETLKESNAGLKEQMEAMESDDENETPEDAIARLTAEVAALKSGATSEDDDDLEALDDDDVEALSDDDVEAMEEEEVHAEMKALRAELKALRAKGKKRAKGKRKFGASAVRTSTNGSRRVARKTAKAEVDRRVKAIRDDSEISIPEATRQVYKEDPELRERFVEEINAA